MSLAPAPVPTPPRAFPGASQGSDVVPGRVSRVLEVARQLTEVSDGLLHLAALMQVCPQGWRGPAARAFGSVLDLDSQPVGRAGAVVAQAADHLRSHAAVLDRAQREADDAVRTDLQASRVTAQWAVAGSSGPDPMVSTRARLVGQVAAARAGVRASAAECARSLVRCRGLAPSARPWWREPAHALGSLHRDVGVGEVKAVAGLLASALTFNTARLALDPVGYRDDVASQVRGTAALVTHPGDLARSVLDLDTWHDSKQIWVGAALPAVVLAAATDDPLATTRLSSFTVRARAALPTARGRALRSAVAQTGAVSRSGLRARDLRTYQGPPSELGTVTRLDPISNAVAESARRDARFGERVVTVRVESVAERLAGERRKPEYVLKDEESMKRKFSDELAGAQRPTAPRVAATVNDTVRYTLVYPDSRYAESSLRTVEELRAEGFGVVVAKSTWDGPRYRGVNLTLHDPRSGRLFEVQTHTPDSFRAGEDTRKGYELYRDAGIDPVHKARLEAEIGARYRLVPTPVGVGHLPAAFGRLGVQASAESTAPALLCLDPRRLAQMSAEGGAVLAAGHGPVPPEERR